MMQNYQTNFLFVFIGMLAFTASFHSNGQELKVFTLADFDLHGTVKSCLVVTDYGKEEFDFDELGFLTKSVTRYNDSDYDITYYKYRNGDVLEKRLENYREGVFDKSTSIANIYEIDTTANKRIIEKIYSYNKDFLDQYEYIYNAKNKLVAIKRSNNDGIDETTISYSRYKNENTKTYFLNETIQKSIRTSIKKKRSGTYEIRLTKEYLDGKPNKAQEQWFTKDGVLLSEEKFEYDSQEKSFVTASSVHYVYDDKGMLSRVNTKKDGLEETKEYIYQYDNEEGGNWVKQIITPDNAYTTRKITYYQAEGVEEEE
ncbi:MAG: hypothetical protein AAFZ89_09775 [Bacteroidota bacterium]